MLKGAGCGFGYLALAGICGRAFGAAQPAVATSPGGPHADRLRSK